MKKLVLISPLLLTLITKCTTSTDYFKMFALFSDLSGFVCPNEYILFEKTTSEYGCMFICANFGSCEGIDYNSDTSVCHGCKGLKEANCFYEPTTFNYTTRTRMYAKDKSFLVSGVMPISDDDLSESSYHDPSDVVKKHSAINARYCKVANYLGAAVWQSELLDTNQWIQARFLQAADVFGIYLLPRNSTVYLQRVKSFKLSYSADCETYQFFESPSGSNMVFPGNHDNLTPITNILPRPVNALCLRIIPVTWNRHIALRFDVIGRYP